MSTMEPDEGNQADAPRWERTDEAAADSADADSDDDDSDDSTDS